jgi:hypothetical protein
MSLRLVKEELTSSQHAPIVAVQQYVLRLDCCACWVNFCEVTINQRGTCIVRLGQHTPAAAAWQQAASLLCAVPTFLRCTDTYQ